MYSPVVNKEMRTVGLRKGETMRTNVWYEVLGQIGEASFRSPESAADFIRRVEANGGVAVVLV